VFAVLVVLVLDWSKIRRFKSEVGNKGESEGEIGGDGKVDGAYKLHVDERGGASRYPPKS